ncbi:MAG: LacI family DNA-binding transcriptional regulator [Sphaerochaetaceae bacterium]|nr:LacI family DNA-binding transcriptional regulator [Sphaerochaetaceae bacterium]
MGIKEIAKKANVSVTTVSLALNGRKGVSEKTRELISRIAQEEGYRVPSDREIATTDNGIILFAQLTRNGKILNKDQHHFILEYINGIQSQLASTGYTFEMISDTVLQIDLLIDRINKKCVKGVIILGTELQEDDIIAFSELNAPFVVIDTYFNSIKAHFISMNNIQGMFQIIKECREIGHTSFAMITSSIRTGNITMRERGFHLALQAYGISETYPLLSVQPGFLGAYEDMNRYLDTKPNLPSLLFCFNDIAAYGIIKALRHHGIGVPQEISVVGFDDISMTTMMDPQLSTVKVANHMIGRKATSALIELIDGGNPEEYTTELVSTSFILRDSVRRLND